MKEVKVVEGVAGHFHSLGHLNIMLIKGKWNKASFC